jgi:geranylgeranyl diphosphate synthase type II
MSLAVDTPAREDLRHDAECALDRFFAGKIALAGRYGPRYVRLWQAARRASSHGKRIRPALVLETYASLHERAQQDGAPGPVLNETSPAGDPGSAAAVAVAVAFELLHTAFLMHDDAIDGDVVRRGEPNLIGSFRADAVLGGSSDAAAAEWGEAASILAGDLLIHAAQSQVAHLDIDRVRREALLNVLDDAVFEAAAGELHDVAFSTEVEPPEVSDAQAMSEWKTASYSFVAPLRAGAILAGAAGSTQRALAQFGRHTGIAFQLRDDLLGVFGDERMTGKSASGDIRRAAKTPLLCIALQSRAGDELRSILGGDPDDAAVARVRTLLRSSGAVGFVERMIDDSIDAARAQLENPGVPARLRAYLSDVAGTAGRRVS